MSLTVLALHTNFALVEPLRPLFAELLPEVRIINLVDDSLLADVRRAGCLTPAVRRRMMAYCAAHADSVQAILSCCSSVGEAVDWLRKAIDIPVVKIDEQMAEDAVDCGSRVGVIATLPTTLDPTARLIESKALQAGRCIVIRRYLADGAFDAVASGNVSLHDRLVRQSIAQAAAENDVVVLAQGSMARLLAQGPQLLNVPILASPRSGVCALKRVLYPR